MTRQGRYPQELRERAVRMVFEHQDEHPSQWAAICSIAAKFGISHETLRNWVCRAEIDDGVRPGLTSEERERLKALERENRELRRANEILKSAAVHSIRWRNTIRMGGGAWRGWDVRGCRTHRNDSYGTDGRPGSRSARSHGRWTSHRGRSSRS
jgi:transposase